MRLPGGSPGQVINDVNQILRGAVLVVMATKFQTKSDVDHILQRPTQVAMATKIETKQAITPLV